MDVIRIKRSNFGAEDAEWDVATELRLLKKSDSLMRRESRVTMKMFTQQLIVYQKQKDDG